MANENIAPITTDIRQGDDAFEIVKGLEHLMTRDESPVAGLLCSMGDWVVKGPNGLEKPGATPNANTYPVLTGSDATDSRASGKVTIIIGGGFIARSKKFAPGSYTAGANLTVKDLGGGEMVPSLAGAGDPVLARVYSAPDSRGVMEILVLNR